MTLTNNRKTVRQRMVTNSLSVKKLSESQSAACLDISNKNHEKKSAKSLRNLTYYLSLPLIFRCLFHTRLLFQFLDHFSHLYHCHYFVFPLPCSFISERSPDRLHFIRRPSFSLTRLSSEPKPRFNPSPTNSRSLAVVAFYVVWR